MLDEEQWDEWKQYRNSRLSGFLCSRIACMCEILPVNVKYMFHRTGAFVLNMILFRSSRNFEEVYVTGIFLSDVELSIENVSAHLISHYCSLNFLFPIL